MNQTPTETPPETPLRVRVMFGPHPVCEHTAPAPAAYRYAAAMRRRFAGLRVEVGGAPVQGGTPLPAPRLWALTVL